MGLSTVWHGRWRGRRYAPTASGPAWLDDADARAAVVGCEEDAMPEEIRAELFANVWKIVASVGDELDPGDAVAILESMKMEIPVITEADGTVSKIAVSEGDVVQEGDLIAVVS